MNNLRGVNILEAPEQLIEEELVVFLSQRLITLDNRRKICIHHLGNDISA
jgi:hypothetical protein